MTLPDAVTIDESRKAGDKMSRRFPQGRGYGRSFLGATNNMQMQGGSPDAWVPGAGAGPTDMPQGFDTLEQINYMLKYLLSNKVVWLNVSVPFDGVTASQPFPTTTQGQSFPLLIMGAATGISNPNTTVTITNNTDSFTHTITPVPALAIAQPYNSQFGYMEWPQPILLEPMKILQLNFVNAATNLDSATNFTFSARELTQTQFQQLESLYGM